MYVNATRFVALTVHLTNDSRAPYRDAQTFLGEYGLTVIIEGAVDFFPHHSILFVEGETE